MTNHLKPGEYIQHYESVICGGVSGLVSRFAISPLDVVKIRLQLSHRSTRLIPLISDIVKNEGLQAFWKGNIPAEIMYVVYGAIEFSTYKMVSNVCVDQGLNNATTTFLSGASAGLTGTVITYPLDILRTRFAAQRHDKVYKSISGGIRQIYLEEGLRGFTKGIGTSIVSVVPYMGLFFWSYGGIRDLLQKYPYSKELPGPEAVAGVISGCISKTMVFPLDVVRRRLQIQGPNEHRFSGIEIQSRSTGDMGGRVRVGGAANSAVEPASLQTQTRVARAPALNAFKMAKNIIHTEGFQGLYRGLSISLIKNAPASAVTMWTFERALKGLRYLEQVFDA